MRSRSWLKRKLWWLYSKILRDRGTPEYVARGWALGMFCGCLLPFGLQLIVSIPMAFVIRGSKIGATIGTFITNHFTVLVIYPAQCWVGSLLLGSDLSWSYFRNLLGGGAELTRERFLELGWSVIAAFFTGGALLTAIMTPLTYFLVLYGVRKYRTVKLLKKSGKTTGDASSGTMR